MATNTPKATITLGTINSDLMATRVLAPATEEEAVNIDILNEINSPPLRLPIELRVLIFEYAVYCPGIQYKVGNNKALSHLRISSTSRQVFRETAELFYSTNALCLGVWEMKSFLRALPEVGRQALRHVQLVEPGKYLYFWPRAPSLEDLYERLSELPALKTVEVLSLSLKMPRWRDIVRSRDELLELRAGRKVLSTKVLEEDEGSGFAKTKSIEFELA